jgi:hypothetical protein
MSAIDHSHRLDRREFLRSIAAAAALPFGAAPHDPLAAGNPTPGGAQPQEL